MLGLAYMQVLGGTLLVAYELEVDDKLGLGDMDVEGDNLDTALEHGMEQHIFRSIRR